MNEVIKLAIEKGGYYIVGSTADGENWEVHDNDLIVDHLFWQALFNALDLGIREEVELGNITYSAGSITWQTLAHEYFDLLLTGGDTEEFWKELLTQNDNDKTR